MKGPPKSTKSNQRDMKSINIDKIAKEVISEQLG